MYEKYVLVGAENVAANVQSLGGQAEVFGLIGADGKGDVMLKAFENGGIGYRFSFSASNRPTTVKTRLIAGGQQVVRVDRESSEEISSVEEERVLKRLPSFIEKIGVIIISDYAKGLVTNKIAEEVIKLAQERGIKVLSDPVSETFHKFKNSYLIKPNKKEAEQISGMKFQKDYLNIKEIMDALHSRLAANLVVTLGKDGMATSDEGGIARIPTLAKEVFDVSGAGDTVMAALSLALGAGGDLKTSALLGNYAAGIVVRKLGTATVSVPEILESIKENGVINYASA